MMINYGPRDKFVLKSQAPIKDNEAQIIMRHWDDFISGRNKARTAILGDGVELQVLHLRRDKRTRKVNRNA